jgi:hypothetical protein
MNIHEDAVQRERTKQVAKIDSDGFWDEVVARHRHLSPADQIALAEAIGKFRAAQAALSAALAK